MILMGYLRLDESKGKAELGEMKPRIIKSKEQNFTFIWKHDSSFHALSGIQEGLGTQAYRRHSY